MRHLVIYFLRHQHIREDPFLNSPISTEQQERKHTAPLLFYRPIQESVWLFSAFEKSAFRTHTVAIEAQKHKTRFKPCNNLQTRQVLCFTFLFGSGSVDVLCSY